MRKTVIRKKKEDGFPYELEMCLNDLEAVTQNLSAIHIATTMEGQPIGPRTLFVPCKELAHVCHVLRILTRRAYKITGKEGQRWRR